MFSNYSYVSGRCFKFRYYSYPKGNSSRNFLVVGNAPSQKCYFSYPKGNSSRNFLVVGNAPSQKCYFSKCLNHCSIFQKLTPNYLSFDKKLKIFKNFNKQFARFASTNGKKAWPDPKDIFQKSFLFILAGLLFFLYATVEIVEVKPLSWNTFVAELLAKGQVEKITVLDEIQQIQVHVRNGGQLEGNVFLTGRLFLLSVADFETFEEDLRKVEDDIGIAPSDRVLVLHIRNYSSSFPVAMLAAAALVLWAISGLKFSVLYPGFQNSAKFTLFDSMSGHSKGITFSDVAGLNEAKVELKEFIDYLKRPEHYKKLGAKVPKGALLLGPPGCGKTLLAKAVATEANVPFLSMNGSEFMEIIGGTGAAKVRDLFSEARKRSPCIIFIDEIDGIGKKRSSAVGWGGGNFEADQTLNQLLVEMDGISSNEGVVTLASTNRAEILDKALLRPGRFDRHILIDLPTVEERREIFMYHLKSKRLEHKPEHYAKRMALLTPGFSGADIGNICNEATLHAARFKKKFVTGDDLEYAIERVIAGAEKISSALSPQEKHLAAYHEAGRALIGWLSEHGDVLLKISVVPRTNLAVGWTQFSPADQVLFSKEELFDKMCMTLGGRAAESLIFNRISTKSQKDLLKVTKIAYAQVRQYGMNNLIGPLSFTEIENYQIKPYSKQLGNLIDEESRKLISQAFFTAESILRENKQKLIKLAEELIKRETMTYDEVVAVIGPPKYPGKKAVEPLMFEMSVMAAAPSDSNEQSISDKAS